MTIDFTGLRIKAETEMGIFKKKSSQEDLGEEVYYFSTVVCRGVQHTYDIILWRGSSGNIIVLLKVSSSYTPISTAFRPKDIQTWYKHNSPK